MAPAWDTLSFVVDSTGLTFEECGPTSTHHCEKRIILWFCTAPPPPPRWREQKTHCIRSLVERRTVAPFSSVVVAVPIVERSTSLCWLQWRLEASIMPSLDHGRSKNTFRRRSNDCQAARSALFQWMLLFFFVELLWGLQQAQGFE